MKQIRFRFIFVFTLVLWAALLAFVIYDTPRRKTPDPDVRYIVVNEPLPWPEEDTMHYITEEGVLIIYAGSQDETR